jgi:hypothetical protein
MIDPVLAGEGSARVAALAARELDDTVAIVPPAIDLAVIEPRTSERKLAAVRRYVSDCRSGVAAPAPDDLVGELLLDDSHRPERGTVGQTRRISGPGPASTRAAARRRGVVSGRRRIRRERRRKQPARAFHVDRGAGRWGYRVAVRPSTREPLTPGSSDQRPEARGNAGPPGDHGPDGPRRDDAVIGRADVTLLYGGQDVVDRYRNRSDILTQGPGRSKLVVAAGADREQRLTWRRKGSLTRRDRVHLYHRRLCRG